MIGEVKNNITSQKIGIGTLTYIFPHSEADLDPKHGRRVDTYHETSANNHILPQSVKYWNCIGTGVMRLAILLSFDRHGEVNKSPPVIYRHHSTIFGHKQARMLNVLGCFLTAMTAELPLSIHFLVSICIESVVSVRSISPSPIEDLYVSILVVFSVHGFSSFSKHWQWLHSPAMFHAFMPGFEYVRPSFASSEWDHHFIQ